MNDAHQVVATYWAAAESRDWDTFADLVAEQVVYEAPQTRERVRGRTAYQRFNAEGFPSGLWSSVADPAGLRREPLAGPAGAGRGR
jgi:hypothetical protein